MQLHGFAARTQLARYYQKTPEAISEEELREYFLYFVNVRKLVRASITIAPEGVESLYQHPLMRQRGQEV